MLKFDLYESVPIASLTNDNLVISEVQDILDLMGDAGFNNCNRMILKEQNLHSDFFRLHTGFAGEILQKFSTYDFKLSIIGDFSKYTSRSLQDFIRESNKGNRIFFVENLSSAIDKLT